MDRKQNKNIIENRIENGTEIIIIKSIIENRIKDGQKIE